MLVTRPLAKGTKEMVHVFPPSIVLRMRAVTFDPGAPLPKPIRPLCSSQKKPLLARSKLNWATRSHRAYEEPAPQKMRRMITMGKYRKDKYNSFLDVCFYLEITMRAVE